MNAVAKLSVTVTDNDMVDRDCQSSLDGDPQDRDLSNVDIGAARL